MLRLRPYSKEINNNGTKEKRFYMVLDRPNTATLEEICALIANRTTLNGFEVELVLNVLHEVVIENMQTGKGTDLGRLGTLLPTISCRSVKTEEELSTKNVEKVSLLYSPSKQIREASKLSNFHFRTRKGE